MWVRVVLVAAVLGLAAGGGVADDPVLHALAGVRGRNAMTVCVRRPRGAPSRRCAAALLQPAWLLARAACLGTQPPALLAALRLHQGGTCELLDAGYNVPGGRYTLARELHPWLDFVLVKVNMPYTDMDELVNATTAMAELKKYGVLAWIEYHVHQYSYVYTTGVASDHVHPLLLLLATFVMPMMLFMAFYIYFIFYTGQEDDEYKRLINNKKTEC